MASPTRLLLATNNLEKARELSKLLKDVPYQIVTPSELGLKLDVRETGATLEANAELKAKAFAQASGLLSIADDSGLEVDALNGEPGVRTARYAGENKTDAQRNQHLLAKLKGVPLNRRTARFRSVIAIAPPKGITRFCEGRVEGLIVIEPKGDKGWGHDPIFYLPGIGKTMGEISSSLKGKYSHRGRAARKAATLLKKLVD
ncbi:MAG: RdgB/HAM1 family non-canonical purine NTP pyrophosphatase [Dehalococcoidia bacterium]|nr:RdgB/HAM1 family non-canonical purine NTP pyrophosphatase [Dehalococcoidia bacterium]